jgi:hypothetical protein
MPKGFNYWFGELDLNNPLDEDFVFATHEDEAGTSAGPSTDANTRIDTSGHANSFMREDEARTTAGPITGANTGIDTSGHANSFMHEDEARTTAGPSTDIPTAPDGVDQSNDPPSHRRHSHSNLRSGVTLSSEDSGSDDEVQSTPEGFAPQKPFVGMIFDTLTACLTHYKRYARHVGFSVRIESSRRSTLDGEKNKSLFVCNKSSKNAEDEEDPLKQRNCKITKLCEYKAKLHVKHVVSRWHVTQFVEEHTHELI